MTAILRSTDFGSTEDRVTANHLNTSVNRVRVFRNCGWADLAAIVCSRCGVLVDFRRTESRDWGYTMDVADESSETDLASQDFVAHEATLCTEDRPQRPTPRSRAQLETENLALRQADRQKDIFIATLAHELRQPIAAMVTAVMLLRKCGGDRTEGRARAVLARQLTHLGRLVDDLLDLARVAEGKLEIQKDRIELRDVVLDAVAGASDLINAHRHSLSIAVPDHPVWIDADRTRIQQVLANLLTNAVKFTDEGGRISLRAESDGVTATIRVCDNGKGIRPDALPQIFDLFVQETTSPLGGLGIGLKIVRGLIESHGGTVVARSDGIGRGSEFIVTLPIPERSDLEERPDVGPAIDGREAYRQ